MARRSWSLSKAGGDLLLRGVEGRRVGQLALFEVQFLERFDLEVEEAVTAGDVPSSRRRLPWLEPVVEGVFPLLQRDDQAVELSLSANTCSFTYRAMSSSGRPPMLTERS